MLCSGSGHTLFPAQKWFPMGLTVQSNELLKAACSFPHWVLSCLGWQICLRIFCLPLPIRRPILLYKEGRNDTQALCIIFVTCQLYHLEITKLSCHFFVVYYLECGSGSWWYCLLVVVVLNALPKSRFILSLFETVFALVTFPLLW